MPLFSTPLDGISTTVAVARSLGSTSLTVASSAGFGTPTNQAPVRITCFPNPTNISNRVHFFVTGISGNTLTIGSPIDGYSDLALPVNAAVKVLVSAGTILELQTAILDVPSGPQGYQGVTGSTGSQGSTGTQGPQGRQGFQGSQGSQGAQGPQGASGGGGGSPGGATTQIQYNNSGSFAGTSSITTDGTNLILGGATLNSSQFITTGGSLVLGQTGGVLGPTYMTIENTYGANGPIFSSTDTTTTLIDFGFITGTNVQSNIRYECRGGGLTNGYGNNEGGCGEFQYFMDSHGVTSDGVTIAFGVGIQTSYFTTNLGIFNYNPQGRVHIQTIDSMPALIVEQANFQNADMLQCRSYTGVPISGFASCGGLYSGNSTTSNRPSVVVTGVQWYDTTLGIPIWWNGYAWTNAMGTTV